MLKRVVSGIVVTSIGMALSTSTYAAVFPSSPAHNATYVESSFSSSGSANVTGGLAQTTVSRGASFFFVNEGFESRQVTSGPTQYQTFGGSSSSGDDGSSSSSNDGSSSSTNH